MTEISKEIGSRIAASRKKKGLSATELAKITGFAVGRISHWEQGRRLPNLESALTLQEALDTPAAYLLAIDDTSSVHEIKENKSLPVFDFSKAYERKKIDSIPISLALYSDHLFAVSLVDQSMSEPFRQGDFIVFDSSTHPSDGDFFLLKIKASSQVLFRQYSIDNTNINKPKLLLKPLNPCFQTITSDSNDTFEIIGVYRNKLRLFL